MMTSRSGSARSRILPDVFSRPIVVAVLTQLVIPVIGVVPHARAATSSTVLAVADASSVEDQIKQDIAYNCELLRSWPRRQEGENVLKNLNLLIQKVGNRQLDGTQRSDTFAELYRCLGGAYLITSGVPDNMRRALPHLTRSLELNPKQTLLEENIKTFKNFLAAGKGDVRLLFTTELQVLRGSDDPEIPGIADGMARYALGSEFQAEHWLLDNATTPSIRRALEELQTRIKNEQNLEFKIDVSSKESDNGVVTVTAKLGPNIFVWTVDLGKKRYIAANELTEGLMKLLLTAEDPAKAFVTPGAQ